MHVLYHHRTAGDRVETVHIMGMVRALRDMGHTVEISSPPGCDPERPPAPGGADAGDRSEGLLRGALKRLARKAPPVVFELAELAYNAYSLVAMWRCARRRGPDMIYERTTSNSVTPTLLSRLWKVPVVQEVNVTADIGRLRPLVLETLTKALERWMVRRTDLFVTVSETFKAMLVERGWPAERILVCQNAIDPGAFDPSQIMAANGSAAFGDGAVVVGYVGAFVPWHRTDMLVDAARELSADHPGARWLLVGDGVEKPLVEAKIERYGLADRFSLPGAVPHERVPCYLKDMDVAVMPHSNTFGSPMKLFEYMAMAKAVVVPRVPAIEEVVTHGETGMLFDPGDQASLTETIGRLIEDSEIRSNMGQKARELVLCEHTWRRNAERVLERLDIELTPGGRRDG